MGYLCSSTQFVADRLIFFFKNLSLLLCFGAGVMYAHIYMDCLHCTLFSVTMLLPIMFFYIYTFVYDVI